MKEKFSIKECKFSITNVADVDLNVVISNYKNRSYLERNGIRNIAKEHLGAVSSVIYGYKNQQNIQYAGVDELIETMGNNPFIVKDMHISSDHTDQLKTTMTLFRLDCNSVQELSFYDFFDPEYQNPVNTIGIMNLGVEMNNQVMLAFEMKAGCSLSLTFIYQ